MRYFLPYNRDLVTFARQMRKKMTPAERKLWYDYLREAPVKVLRQRPIDNFIVDFYIASRKLVIEVDGGGHFTAAGIKRDKFRTEELEKYGLTVIRFTNSEVLNSFASVVSSIEEYLA